MPRGGRGGRRGRGIGWFRGRSISQNNLVGNYSKQGSNKIQNSYSKLGSDQIFKYPGYVSSVKVHPLEWIEENCIWCRKCEEVCPRNAITIEPQVSWKIDEALCVRCGLCVRACPTNALSLNI